MEFTHFNHQGRARMVDVSEKADTLRTATAKARVLLNADTYALVKSGGIKKGDVLTKDFLRNYQPITPEAYENLISEYLTTLQDFTANFEWFQVEGSVDTATLTKSWEVFRSSLG